MSRSTPQAAETVRLANEIHAWLEKIGAASTGAAVDFADIITAGWHVERLVRHLITLDPANPDEANQALLTLGEMYAWLFTELRHHVAELERSWETLENCL